MKKNYLFIILLIFLFPLKLEATTTEGQIQFFEGNTEESKPLVPPVEEKEDTISSFPKTIITSDGNKNKQRLLQTNDTINYSMSLIGFLLFFYAIYQLRRNLK
ncbi:hypothetical protein [uncultured Vagococcus sp.]|jgi:hypothetical protein|uniref:hypothetical protein n=1 Tax=uncultured Vagococcus sp. TaxID=189676 RepID=UPI00258FA33C|nr:hypothetical protein [uncultured Vagococcus sp.]